MEIPRQFRDIALRMHQDVHLLVSLENEYELIDYLVRGVTAEQAKAAAGFIDSLLSSARSKQELVTIWADAGADWFFGKDDIVPFLRQLRDRLLREQ